MTSDNEDIDAKAEFAKAEAERSADAIFSALQAFLAERGIRADSAP